MYDFLDLLGVVKQYEAQRYQGDRCRDVFGANSEKCTGYDDEAENIKARLDEWWFQTIRAVAREVALEEIEEHNTYRKHGRSDDY